MSDDAEMKALLSFSARIGREPTLVQASTGNVSIKTRGLLWVKASGTWLADADNCDILVPLDLACVRRSVLTDATLPDGHDNTGRRASVETAMHAILPHKIVVHLHSVNSIACGVRHQARRHLTGRLDELSWEWIPYVASGLPLAHAVQEALETSPHCNVFLLGNHGLVICAETTEAAEALLLTVERRLEILPRQSPDPNYPILTRLAGQAGWHLPENERIHSLGTDAFSRRFLSGGILYPCQALFWKEASSHAFTFVAPHSASQQIAACTHNRSFLIVEGCGVIVSQRLSAAEHEVLLGLAHVMQRVDPQYPIRYLTEAEVFGISANSGSYRAQLARASVFTS